MKQVGYFQLLAPALRTSNGDTKSTPFKRAGLYTEGRITLKVTAEQGTSPELTVRVLMYDQHLGDWIPVYEFTKVSGSPSYPYTETISVYNFGGELALEWEIGGSNTPGFSFGVTGVFKN